MLKVGRYQPPKIQSSHLNGTTSQALNDLMEQSPRNRSLSSYIKKIAYYFLFEQIFYRKRSSRALNNLLQYSLHLLKYKLWPAPIDTENQMNQSDFKANTCSRYKAREKSVSKSWFILFSILIGRYSWVRGFSQSQSLAEENRVPSTKSFCKIESKCNTTFWVVPAQKLREQRNI